MTVVDSACNSSTGSTVGIAGCCVTADTAAAIRNKTRCSICVFYPCAVNYSTKVRIHIESTTRRMYHYRKRKIIVININNSISISTPTFVITVVITTTYTACIGIDIYKSKPRFSDSFSVSVLCSDIRSLQQ